ncbi:DUF6776 family protein [Endozoicomonas numazuensis]|uniref:Uncharacterized protein n=1 Tax=Endozoicomonas numazuensis TaxID=1137799 RepID=A0A081NKX5_9GAMM|nr:DUF6776 family protein [Endozoicomonas numazuensis]KEQ19098.1 hypothetical protein GZ78_03545 [Endozoicomonas numazuensis]
MPDPRSIFQGVKPPGNMKVVRHDPGRERKIRLFVVLGVILVTAVAYYLGGRISDTEAAKLQRENSELKSQSKELEREKEKLKQKLVILERTSKVDREATNSVRTVIRNLEDEKALLSKDLAFYKSILAPEDSADGIRLHAFDLLPGEEKNQYRFRMVVSQVARDNPFLKGTLNVTVKGLKEDKKESLSLLELAGMEKSQALGFRYFQSFPDNRDYIKLTLPDGFEPEKVMVSIKVKNGAARSLTSVLNWQEELEADMKSELTESR